MKLCIALIVLGVLLGATGPQSVSAQMDEVTIKLFYAIHHGDLKAVEREANADNVNVINDLGENSLFTAISYGNEQIIEKLIEKGADVNHVALGQRTPLTKARFDGKHNIAELLIRHGAH